MSKKTEWSIERGDIVPLKQLDGCINTVSGKKFNLLKPTPDMVDLEDICRGLAYKGHFSGLTTGYFSIASHSLLVRELLGDERPNAGIKLLLAALLHDASEAYTGDIIKPLKVHLPFFMEVEDKIMAAIFEHFDLDLEWLPLIKPFDLQAQLLEYGDFYKNENNGLKYLNPHDAYLVFKQEVKGLL